MWALVYKLNEVSLKEINSYDEIKEEEFVEAHIFSKDEDIHIDINKQVVHLENKEKDSSNKYYDEEMSISKVFNSLNKSNYKTIKVRNYLDYSIDGILYVSSYRLLEVK